MLRHNCPPGIHRYTNLCTGKHVHPQGFATRLWIGRNSLPNIHNAGTIQTESGAGTGAGAGGGAGADAGADADTGAGVGTGPSTGAGSYAKPVKSTTAIQRVRCNPPLDPGYNGPAESGGSVATEIQRPR